MNGVLHPRLREAVQMARAAGASDVHLVSGMPPAIRVDGAIRRTNAACVGGDELRAIVRETLPELAFSAFERTGSASAAHRDAECGALRVHAFTVFGGLALAVRLLPEEVPTAQSLGLPPVASALAEARAGLLLICGPAGSGKTTAMAALVDGINRTRAHVIVTIEDPIEYRHRSVRSTVLQREIGEDAASFEEALYSALRSDPDTIVLGELRSQEAMRVALRAAETGHLVLTTLHAPDTARAVARIVEAFPPERQSAVRSELADVLVGALCRRLLPRCGGGRCGALEVLIALDSVRSLVRDGKFYQLRNAIQLGRASGMQTLEDDLRRLMLRGDASPETVRAAASRPQELDEAAGAIA